MNRNSVYNQEALTKNNKLKIKIFEYFYHILSKKNKTHKISLFFWHIFETFQIISYAFDEPHLITWKISKKYMQRFSLVISIFRISSILYFFSITVYYVVFLICVAFNFVLFIIIILQIMFYQYSSRFYNGLMSITHISIAPLTIFLYTPITEIILILFICDDSMDEISQNNLKCYKGIHLFYSILGILSLILFIITLLFINYFYFFPFQSEISTQKLNSRNDIILLITKLIYSIRLIFVKNEYISIAILLLFSIYLLFKEFKNPTYNINLIEIIINIRNFLIVWTYFMLLVAKIFQETEINGLIYLVFVGYPIIIFTSTMLLKGRNEEANFQDFNINNIDSCLSKTRFMINLINSFFEDKNNNLKNNEFGNKNNIILKGMIKLHSETCLNEDCPLMKFMKSSGKFNIQKQCLLNYMSIYFKKAIKNFPFNKILKLYYIHFNFSKKYNLNSVRGTLEQIKKMQNTIKEEFIIYCLENEIIKIKDKTINLNEGNESEQDAIILEQNYKRLKYLITNSTKLYVEFWGIFSTNITNNLNTSKLYKIGEKLNIYLKEINYLWENNLKNKKIEVENEYIAQLYSKFLKEILWDKVQSEEVQKKIAQEYHIQGYKKLSENQKLENIENIIENQDYVIFVNSNERGKCTIFQFSNSLSYLIGYKKQQIINKPLEVLFPNILIDGHAKKVEEFIKNNHTHKNIEKESFHGAEKKKTFILIKSKMGYLVPFNAKFTIFDDNDFSNSFVIKTNLELRDAKSTYAYYILTNQNFSVDNISSSAIHLGLTMDLLKKYVIKLNILVRTSKDMELDLTEKYKNYIEDTRKVTWVYPNVIYPKNDSLKNKELPLQDLIKNSKKNKFYLQIFEMKYKENEIKGFVFKFIDIQKNKKYFSELSPRDLLPTNKNEIIFDLLTLNYIRTIIVQHKSGLRNLRENEEHFENKQELSSKLLPKRYNRAKQTAYNPDSDDDDQLEMALTKEKVLELQTTDSFEISTFINLLPFYGDHILLIKQRPSKEQYSCGRTHEPSIRIHLNDFIKKINKKVKNNPSFYNKVIKNNQNENKEFENILVKSNENIGLKENNISNLPKSNEIDKKEKKEINNEDLIGDSSIALSNIFNENSINNIKLAGYSIYFLILIILIIDFVFTYRYIINNKNRILYLDNFYKLINIIDYTKYFITEAIITNSVPNYLISENYGKEDYLNMIRKEISNCHQEFTKAIDYYNFPKVKLSKDFINYISYYNITIKTLNNGFLKDEIEPFNSAMNRLSNSIFYISTISDLKEVTLNNKYSYELMANLISGYYTSLMRATMILLNDVDKSSKNPCSVCKIMIFFSLIITLIFLIVFWRIMLIFIYDREKPINLFLTIKKNIFEDLKNSVENFSNKLLNKFFGNEENEEESQQEYKINIKQNDINIAKFKSLNEDKLSMKKGTSSMSYFGYLISFFIFFEIYIIAKYFNSKEHFSEVFRFVKVYNMTYISYGCFLESINIIKQYFFNDTLPILGPNRKPNNTFYHTFHNIEGELSNALLVTSKTDCFLKNEYRDLFILYFYYNYSDIIQNDYIKNNSYYLNKLENGFKLTIIESYEILRNLYIQYFYEGEHQKVRTNSSELINDEKWYLLNELLIYLIRPWYENILSIMSSSFFSISDNLQVVYISLFTLIIIVFTLMYLIVWKSYEERLHILLKKSFDLINLIPKEIKNIIVSKLNE